MLDSIITELKNWLRGTFNESDYSTVLVEVRDIYSEKYRGGNVIDTSKKTMIIVKGECLHYPVLSYCASSLETELRIERLRSALRFAKDNFIPTRVTIPRKTNPVPEPSNLKAHSPDDLWTINPTDNLFADLKSASALSHAKFIPESAYTLERSRFFFVNSFDISLTYELVYFMVFTKVIISNKKSVMRRVGFCPNNANEVNKVYRLIPFLSDITLEQDLRKSKDFTEVMTNLIRLADNLYINQVDIKSGEYAVVTPMTTFSHEALGHLFENEIVKSREFLDETQVIEDYYFVGGQEIGPDYFVFRDNPALTLRGLKLIGTRDYDCEGFKMRIKTHLHHGKCAGERLGSRYSIGSDYGNAIAHEPCSIPQPRMSVSETFYNTKGPKSMKELLEDSKKVLVCIRHQGNVDSHTGVFSIGESENYDYYPEIYIYSKGELYPVKTPHIVTGIAGLALKDIVLASNWSVTYDPGVCDRSSPTTEKGDWVYSSQVGPLALIKNTYIRAFRSMR